MGYHLVEVASLPVTPDRDADRRSVSEHAELSNVAVNVYDAEPGEAVPLAYHYHDDQEEVFYVLDGTLHVETPEEEYVVERDEAFVAEPDSPHRAFNPSDAQTSVRVLAVGAPAVDDVHAYDPDHE